MGTSSKGSFVRFSTLTGANLSQKYGTLGTQTQTGIYGLWET